MLVKLSVVPVSTLRPGRACSVRCPDSSSLTAHLSLSTVTVKLKTRLCFCKHGWQIIRVQDSSIDGWRCHYHPRKAYNTMSCLRARCFRIYICTYYIYIKRFKRLTLLCFSFCVCCRSVKSYFWRKRLLFD